MNQKSFDFVDIDSKRLARRTDPETSHQAAVRQIRSGRAASNKRRLYDCVCEHPGLTSKEYGILTGIDRHEAARRLADLKNAGEVLQVMPAKGGNMVTWRPAT